MPDSFRTLLAKFLARPFTRPRRLIVQAWFRLAAETDDTEEKWRRLNAILELDPDKEPATLALLVLDHKRPEN